MEISVCPVPLALRPEQLDRATAVVIDVLRMTSVAVTALSHGCAGILAVETVEEARAEAASHGALLGGERGAVRIDGFDLDNSPLNYTAERVSGRRLVMTTSNGTRALAAARLADRVLLAGFLNASAVARALAGAEKVCILCAGTNGGFSLEDALAAGAILERLPGAAPDDMALASLRLYRQSRGDLKAALAETLHFGRLRRLGFEADLDYCLCEDTLGAVPERGADGWIR